MLSGKSGLLWVIALSLVTALLFFTVPNHQLAFDRDLIAQGEGWRIITGNLAHTNLWHLLLNLSGLCVIYSLFREYLTGWRLPVLGVLLRKYQLTLFSRSLGTLLGNGVSLLPALRGEADRVHPVDEPVGYELSGNEAL